MSEYLGQLRNELESNWKFLILQFGGVSPVENFPSDASRWVVPRLALFLTVSLDDVVGNEQAKTNDESEHAKHYSGSEVHINLPAFRLLTISRMCGC